MAKFCACSQPTIEDDSCSKCNRVIELERLKRLQQCQCSFVKPNPGSSICSSCGLEIPPHYMEILERYEKKSSLPPRERLDTELSSLIPESEEIVYFAGCSIRGRNAKDPNFVGTIVITKKNVYLVKRKFKVFGKPDPLTKETMSISQITGLDQTFESYLTIKSFHIRITRANNEDVLYGLTESIASEIIESINNQMNNQGYSSGSVMINAVDPVEQLTKLAALLEKGLVTQEEFDTKKKELLGL